MKKSFYLAFSTLLLFVFGSYLALAQTDSFLLIAEQNTDPAEIIPGKPFALTLVIKNIGDRRAKDINVVLKVDKAGEATGQPSDSGLITTLDSSNVRFLERIDEDEQATVSYRLIADGKAESKVHNLEVELNYKVSGLPIKDSQSIGLVVLRNPDLRVINLKVPAKVAPGKEFTLSAEVANVSGFAVNGVMLKFEIDKLKPTPPISFVGTLEPGDSDVLESKAKATKDGVIKGMLIVSFKDDFNHDRSLEKEFKIKVSGKKETQADKSAKGFGAKLWNFIKSLFGLGEKSD